MKRVWEFVAGSLRPEVNGPVYLAIEEALGDEAYDAVDRVVFDEVDRAVCEAVDVGVSQAIWDVTEAIP